MTLGSVKQLNTVNQATPNQTDSRKCNIQITEALNFPINHLHVDIFHVFSSVWKSSKSVSACEAQLFVADLKVSDDLAHHVPQALLSSGIESSLLCKDFNDDLRDQLEGEKFIYFSQAQFNSKHEVMELQ